MVDVIAAGIDIGNSTTEVMVADLSSDGVTPLLTRRAWTVGDKGSEESVRGAARLVLNAEKDLGRSCDVLLLAPLQPVLTMSASIPPPPEGRPILTRLNDSVAGTPSGVGFAVGVHVPWRDLAGGIASADGIVVSVPRGVDFEEAAAAIAAAQNAGLPIVGAVVAEDDAVLISNRIPLNVPIVDEADVDDLRSGELIALEVAAPGARVQVLNDPVALVAAFQLVPDAASSLTGLTHSLADARCAALALCQGAEARCDVSESGWLEYDGEGGAARVPLSPRIVDYAHLVRPGSVRRLRIPPHTPLHSVLGSAEERVRDVFAVDLPSIREQFLPRHGSVDLDQVPLSVLLAQDHIGSPADRILESATGRPVRVVTSEAEAAALGALTTPGAPHDAAVCDIGGGTIDLVCGDERITAAGAGELLTTAVAKALDLQMKSAEYVKRFSSFRPEGPHVVHYEDGSRGFVDAALPSNALGRLCYTRGRSSTPFSDLLAPEEWRSLRLAIKRGVIGASVDRCLTWLRVRPRIALLCGGAALDSEAVRIVGDSLRGTGTTVGKANIGGAYGPRFGVAMGLLLAFQRSGREIDAPRGVAPAQ
jgi:Diol dehydratase reactivase ATPase-like domain/DD-reactivating factor swiveling domain